MTVGRTFGRSATLRSAGNKLLALLPLLLMAFLSAWTWWLASRSPPSDGRRAMAALQHEADYTMQRFTVQRYDRTGRLKAQIEGDVMRHFPDTDTYEIDNVRLTATTPDGHTTRATALRSLSNADGSEVQLIGSAHVLRDAQANEQEVEFRSEFLDVFVDTERVRTHLPVVLTQGASRIEGGSLDYDNLNRTARLTGRVKATFPAATPPPRRGR